MDLVITVLYNILVGLAFWFIPITIVFVVDEFFDMTHYQMFCAQLFMLISMTAGSWFLIQALGHILIFLFPTVYCY